MAHIIVPSRRIWTRQPQQAVEIDPNNFFGAACLFASVGGAPPTFSGAVFPSVGVAGICQKAPATQQPGYAQWPLSIAIAAGKDYSIGVIAKPSTEIAVIATHEIAGDQANALAIGATGAQATLDNNLSGLATYSGSMPELYMGCRIGNQVHVYVPSGASASAITGTRAQTLTAARAGRASGNNLVNTETYGIFVFARSWSVREYLELSRNPWQIFRPQVRRSFFDMGAGGGSTLNASAAGAAQSSGSATLTAQVALAGVGVALAGGSAAASVAVPLSAAGLAVAGGSGDASATVTIAAAGLAQAAGAAGLSASVLLAGAGAAQAAGNAELAAQLEALAAGAAQASGSANLSGGAPGNLSASGGDVASGLAVLSVTVALQAAGAAQASGSASGSAGAPGDISASGGAQGSGSAIASATVTLTVAGFVQAMGSGQMAVQVSLAAYAQAVSSGSASISQAGVTVLLPAGGAYLPRRGLLCGVRPPNLSAGRRPRY